MSCATNSKSIMLIPIFHVPHPQGFIRVQGFCPKQHKAINTAVLYQSYHYFEASVHKLSLYCCHPNLESCPEDS